MSKRENIKRMYRDIQADFNKMDAKGKYKTSYIINELATKYYKSPHTIANILFRRVK